MTEVKIENQYCQLTNPSASFIKSHIKSTKNNEGKNKNIKH